MFGHVAELLEQDVDFVFLPALANRENIAPGQTENNYCTFIAAVGHLVTANVEFGQDRPRPLKLPFHLLWPGVRKQEFHMLARALGVSERRIEAADAAALAAQRDFYAALRSRGQQVLANLPADQPAVVLVGRPYNTADLSVCQDLPFRLRRLGVLPIPMDLLPLDGVDISDDHGRMFWRGGQAILSAARIIRDDPRLHAIYVTNFNCGPDSFLLGFFRRTLGLKPFLELEFDDHTADAGVITRCEAFVESLGVGEGASR